MVSLGEINYRLISGDGDERAALSPLRYVRGSYSPAFDETHRQAMPDYTSSTLASGQNTAVAGLLATMGGSGFVLEATAQKMVAGGGFHLVKDVDPIGQPVFAVMHQRHRTSRMHRRLTRIVSKRLASSG